MTTNGRNGNPSALLASALDLAGQGWHVLPLHHVAGETCSCGKPDCKSEGKHPRTAHGLRDATTDAQTIRRWWRRWPSANVGVRTGPESGVWMLGPDGQSGIEALAELVRQYGELPRTPSARSGSGGHHYYFRWPAEGGISNRKNHRGLPIDVRGQGGYFVAAPSRNALGPYVWEVRPDDCELAEAPAWLLEWCRQGVAEGERPSDTRKGEAGGASIIDRAIAYLAKVPPAVSGQGGHPQTLEAARAVVWGFDLGAEAGYALLAAHYNPRCEPPWSERELRHKCQEADRVDFGKPRGWLLSDTNRREGRHPGAASGRASGKEPEPPDPLDRLGDVLAEDNPEGLYGDAKLLDALAWLAESNPTQWASRRAQLKAAGVSLRDFDKALAGRRAALRAELPPRVAEAGYRVVGGRLVRDTLTPNGAVEVPLANFTAKIVAQTVADDGAERSVRLAVEGQLCDGRTLPRVEVPAADFAGLAWILPAWGTRPVVYAGRGTADHLRCAVQLLSGDVAERVVYGHLGWREIGERWVYLHAGGAIGADGPVEGVEVDPPPALQRYVVPGPPTGEALHRAVRASLALLDFGPPRLAFPLVAAVYRAVLGGADFALHLAGQTGAFKSEAAALMQQHYGAELDARHLPASWASTGNSLEGVAFVGKDVLLVVDDYAPSGSIADMNKLSREAERIVRAQGNAAGRQRMRADGGLRPEKPPRGLILSTGEDVPRGQSIRARLLILEVSRGDFSPDRLTVCQRDAAAGLYAGALAGFLRWLAPRYEDVRRRLAAERAELRNRTAGDGQHARTPGIVADLVLGLKYLFDFAVEAGTLTHAERGELARRGWKALREAAAAQAEYGRAAEPTALFLRLLVAALASGRAHVAGQGGMEPEAPAAWGWRGKEYTHRGESGSLDTDTSWQPQGRRIGWVDGEDVYLEPEASYAAAQEMAAAQGEALPVSASTLRRRLKDAGLLASTQDNRQEITVRRVLEGRRRNVLHLCSSCLSCTEPAQPAHGAENSERNGRVCGRVAEAEGRNPPTKPAHFRGGNGFVGGLGGLETGRDASAPEISADYLAPGLAPEDARTPFDDG